MYTGTMIEDLIATVARAEEHVPREPKYIKPIVINGAVTWGFVYEAINADHRLTGVA